MFHEVVATMKISVKTAIEVAVGSWVISDRERREDEQRDGNHGEADRTPAASAHCALTAVDPNRPCGLIESTITTAAKNTTGDHVGDHATATTSLITSRKIAAAIAPPMLPIPPRITIASSREIRS